MNHMKQTYTTSRPKTNPRSKTNKGTLAEAAFAKLLADASKPGFHGTAGIVLTLQDGHIQYLRVSVDEIIK